MPKRTNPPSESVLITDYFRCNSDSWVVRIVADAGHLKARISDATKDSRTVCYTFPGVANPDRARNLAFDRFFDDQFAAWAAGGPFLDTDDPPQNS